MALPVKTLALEELAQTKFQTMMDQAAELKVPDPLFFQLLSQVPGYTEALFDALIRSHATGNVDHKLKEMIRIQLARFAEDKYFANMRSQKAMDDGLTEERIDAACGDFENDPQFSDAEKWALKYARLMYTEPKLVNGEFYAEGKKYYSEAEIMEIGSFLAFHYGMQVFTRTLGAFPMFDKDGNLVSQTESAKIYGG